MQRLYSCLAASMCFLLLYSTTGLAQQAALPETWWKETVFYQIYMPSYADSNGDGYGDFNGITSKLDYLKNLGIKGIWLTPFLKSPKVDNGYDVANYYAVDPVYGSIEDFKIFLKEAHSRDIKVIMDMVVNHTSTESEWFKEAQKSKNNPYRDYYIWKDKPNNWESFFGGTAWQLSPQTGQYYYHKFDVTMADLNWSNPQVVSEIKQVLRYWLDLGVDGFRFDVINFLTTDGITKDNPVKDGKQEHVYDIDQSGVKEVLKKLKSIVSQYPNRFTVGEIGSDKITILRQYQSADMMDVVFNFNFGSIAEFSVEKIFRQLQDMEQEMPGYPTLFFGSHDMPRMLDRLAGGNTQKAVALTALTLTARGVPFIYYGEEIGMHNSIATSYNEIIDIQGKTHYRLAIEDGKTTEEALKIANENNRDKSRSPMQWDNSENAGFSTSVPWIKVNPDYIENNVAKLSADTNSILSQYKNLIALRNSEPALQYGSYSSLTCNDNVIVFTRTLGNTHITAVLNFGNPFIYPVPDNAILLSGQALLKTNSFCIYKIVREQN
ncbi:alpha-glucosidase [Flavobacterium rhizosphaerae]|uniref:Alpha-glucosidase n=1 Tax=Flavobacterium rhizosphaerae TaxID=3163298 RepID=A0ABW8Z1E6_9FLAO